MSTVRPPRLLRLRRVSHPRLGFRGLLVAATLVVVLGGVFAWYRQSSFVAVREVTITGVSGPSAAAVRNDLQATARQMTTLDVDHARLRRAVAAYPFVDAVRVRTHFPHGVTVAVTERIPVATVLAAGQPTAVDGTGRLLSVDSGHLVVPSIAAPVGPNSDQLTGVGLLAAHLLAAAPYPLLAKVAEVGMTRAHGLQARLRDGPLIEFGGAAALRRKWGAAVAVLASGTAAGASYIDVSTPSRPAAGVTGRSRSPGASSETTTSSTSTTG